MPLRNLLCAGFLTVTLPGCRERDVRTVRSVVDAAPGLREGAAVTYRGVQIGTVRRVAFSDSGVTLELRIEHPGAPLRTGDRVAVRPIGVFGDAAVSILPGPSTAPALAEGSTLRGEPADTLGAVREAVARALLREAVAPLLRQGSADSTAAPSSARP